eukprot:TRINITY_DN1450_c0_g1_i9.p1 TRINITY_DN1450_c0_g1~~TRINITY_DN1450_c0_g1_i9.p1  ORF type:complete len:277 (-),score=66.52 TRINITY_DN1450_c0_g1_i9:1902-2732(-)
MTVVEGYFGGEIVGPDQLRVKGSIPPEVLDLVVHNCGLNRSCEVHFEDGYGKTLQKPKVIGSAIEGALAMLAKDWGFNPNSMKRSLFDPNVDLGYPFNAAKSSSSVLVTRKDNSGGLRLFCKGASSHVLKDCAFFTGPDGKPQPLMSDSPKRRELEEMILGMADKALCTICIAHIDFASTTDLPSGWQTECPDSNQMICDAVVGIMLQIPGDGFSLCDTPGGPDSLNYQHYAIALTEQARYKKSWPLAVGIYGQWGTGKARAASFGLKYHYLQDSR